MKVLDLIHQKADRLGLAVLLIGGHAINALGDRRQTRDNDTMTNIALRFPDLAKTRPETLPVSIGEIIRLSEHMLPYREPQTTKIRRRIFHTICAT